jgi:carbon monoxide dehydrogenase subunit G
MDLTGRYAIPARPNAVWDALNDPEILQPGCETVEAPA